MGKENHEDSNLKYSQKGNIFDSKEATWSKNAAVI